MIWIVLTILLLITFIGGIRNKDDFDDGDGLTILTLAICILILSLTIFHGVKVYPELISLKSKAEVIYSEVDTIKNAYYKNEQKSSLIAGSLDNYKQSTNLSQYIKQYAELKAEYNSSLKYYQTIKKMWTYKLFGHAIFISNRIYDLKEL